MYTDRQDLIASIGATATLERSYDALGELLTDAPGFVSQTVLRSYAYPNKYTLVTRWDDVESAWAFSASEKLTPFLKGLPAGLFTRTRYEGYDTAIDVASSSLKADDAKVVQFAEGVVGAFEGGGGPDAGDEVLAVGVHEVPLSGLSTD